MHLQIYCLVAVVVFYRRIQAETDYYEGKNRSVVYRSVFHFFQQFHFAVSVLTENPFINPSSDPTVAFAHRVAICSRTNSTRTMAMAVRSRSISDSIERGIRRTTLIVSLPI